MGFMYSQVSLPHFSDVLLLGITHPIRSRTPGTSQASPSQGWSQWTGRPGPAGDLGAVEISAPNIPTILPARQGPLVVSCNSCDEGRSQAPPASCVCQGSRTAADLAHISHALDPWRRNLTTISNPGEAIGMH